MGNFVLPTVYFQNSLWNHANPGAGQVLIAWHDNGGGFLTYPGSAVRPQNNSGDRDDQLLPNTGFAALNNANSGSMIVDVGPYGSKSNPNGSSPASGHGQFDLLNINFSAYGRELIVDPGYETNGSEENTANHNTISVASGGFYQNNGAYGFAQTGASYNDTAADTYFGATFLNTSQTTSFGGGYQIEGAHTGFSNVNATTAYRTVWSDDNSMYLIGDWTDSNAATNVETGFYIPGVAALGAGYASHIAGMPDNGNIYVLPVALPSGTIYESDRRIAIDRTVTRYNDDGTTTNFPRLRMTDFNNHTAFVNLVYMTTSLTNLPSASITHIDSNGNITVVITQTGQSNKTIILQKFDATVLTATPPNSKTTTLAYSPPAAGPLVRLAAAPAALPAASSSVTAAPLVATSGSDILSASYVPPGTLFSDQRLQFDRLLDTANTDLLGWQN
jgi:hypothetical protein